MEVGARGNLTTFVEDSLRGQAFCAVPVNVQRRSGITQLNHLVGLLSVHGVALDFGHLYQRRRPRLVAWEDGANRTIAANPPPSSRIALNSGWPMMRLDDDAVRRIRAAGPAPSNGLPADATPVNGAATSPPPAAPTPPITPCPRLRRLSRPTMRLMAWCPARWSWRSQHQCWCQHVARTERSGACAAEHRADPEAGCGHGRIETGCSHCDVGLPRHRWTSSSELRSTSSERSCARQRHGGRCQSRHLTPTVSQ